MPGGNDGLTPRSGRMSLTPQPPIPTLVKTVDVASANPGDQVVYTLTYGNAGGAPATGVLITDTLPPFIDFQSASGGGTYDGGSRTVTWTIGTIRPGESAAVTVTCRINPSQNFIGSAVLDNSAAIACNEVGVVRSAVSATTITGQPAGSARVSMSSAYSTGEDAGQTALISTSYTTQVEA